MIVHMRTVEKEKEEMRKKYKQMEDELELRRQEIFQMKRESSTQYVMEERENWKAVMAQQQQVISKLEKGEELADALGVDLAISQERSSALQQQLDTLEIKEEPKIGMKKLIPRVSPWVLLNLSHLLHRMNLVLMNSRN